jgi:hypothetical protein
MDTRNFANPNNIPQLIAQQRVRDLDPRSTVYVLPAETVGTTFIEVGSSLTTSQIESLFSTPVTAAENQALADFDAAGTGFDNLPGWGSWTVAEFNTWCTNNLMTDAQIDASAGLSAALKENLKANNAFTRNGGKAIIYLRDYVMSLRR